MAIYAGTARAGRSRLYDWPTTALSRAHIEQFHFNALAGLLHLRELPDFNLSTRVAVPRAVHQFHPGIEHDRPPFFCNSWNAAGTPRIGLHPLRGKSPVVLESTVRLIVLGPSTEGDLARLLSQQSFTSRPWIRKSKCTVCTHWSRRIVAVALAVPN